MAANDVVFSRHQSATVAKSDPEVTRAFQNITSRVNQIPLLDVRSTNANTTLTDARQFTPVDASSGAVTVTLPPASKVTNKFYHIKKTDSSANAVTVQADGSETIDGANTAVITIQYESISIVSDGSQWWIY